MVEEMKALLLYRHEVRLGSLRAKSISRLRRQLGCTHTVGF